jgi:hypothetical protein
MNNKFIYQQNKKIYWLYLCVIFCLFFIHNVSGQSAPSGPKITPPSLTAQAFMRYGEIPVDYSTGVPNISIPLYTIKGRKLELPLSISYHASGIKVNDVATSVGLGWVLNCGGIVARSIFGKKDEAAIGTATYTIATQMYDAIRNGISYLVNGEYPWLYDFDQYVNNNFNELDPQSDRFFYSLPNGTSGVFRYDFITNEIIKLPYKPLIIRADSSGNSISGYHILRFKITDEQGIVYTFERYNQYTEYLTNSTDYLLTKIVSADKTDSIQINYGSFSSTSPISTLSSTYLGTISYDDGEDCVDHNGSYYVTYPTLSRSASYSYEGPLVSSVVTPTTTVNFSYSSRTDFSTMSKLNSITIISNSGNQTLKTIQFNTDYFGSGNNARLKLNEITVSSPGNTNSEVYSFQYDSQLLPDYPGKLGAAYARYNEDYWGYNNNSNSISNIPVDFVPDAYKNNTDFNGNRNPDPITSKACMLYQVTYPTGGRTVFNFERNYAPNVYSYRTTNKDGYIGGFRVASILSYDENSTLVNTKTYKYDDPRIRPITTDMFKYTMHYWVNNSHSEFSSFIVCFLNYYRDIISSQALLPLEVAVGLPIMYQTVTEYNGTETNNSGKTVYKYNAPYSPSDVDLSSYEYPRTIHPYHYDKGNFNPEMESMKVYSYYGQNYHLVSRTVNNYTELYPRTFNTGINLVRLKEYISVDAFQNAWNMNASTYADWIAISDTKAFQVAYLLTGTDNYTYDPTDSTKYIVNSTHLEYDSTYIQLTKQTVSTSVSGKNKETYFTHPYHYSSQAPYSSMVQMNNVSPVIEESSYMSGVFTQSARTNYAYWKKNESLVRHITTVSSQSTPMIYPLSVDTKTGSNPYATQLNFNNYDGNGNVVSFAQKDGVKEIYIWSYNGTYPVAKIINGDYSTIESALGGADALKNFFNISAPSDEYVRTFLLPLRSNSATSVYIYTYKPLVGMTSMTDPRGVTTYYEYDDFNRLEYTYIIENGEKKILQKNEYHYANQ